MFSLDMHRYHYQYDYVTVIEGLYHMISAQS